MKKLWVSVVIPCHNCEKYINKTLSSVFNQSYKNIEVIVVNDGSTDNSLSILKNYSNKYENIKIIDKANKGVAAARNTAIKISKGEFIAFLDADDIWHKDNIEKKVNYLIKNNLNVVHSNAIIIDENDNELNKFLIGKSGNLFIDILLWTPDTLTGPSSFVIKKDIIKNVGFFDKNLSTAADKDFFIRVAHKYYIGHIPETLWKYRVHKDNMHKNIRLMEHDELYILQNISSHPKYQLSNELLRRIKWKTYIILGLSYLKIEKSIFNFLKYFFLSFALFPIKTTIRMVKKQ